MGAEDTLDEAEPAAASSEGDAQAEAASEPAAAPPPLTVKDRWSEAFNCYTAGNYALVIQRVEEILADEPNTELRPRLERLLGRARMSLERAQAEAAERQAEDAVAEAETASAAAAAGQADSDIGPAPEIIGQAVSDSGEVMSPLLGQSDESDEGPLTEPSDEIAPLAEPTAEDAAAEAEPAVEEAPTEAEPAGSEAPAAVQDAPRPSGRTPRPAAEEPAGNGPGSAVKRRPPTPRAPATRRPAARRPAAPGQVTVMQPPSPQPVQPAASAVGGGGELLQQVDRLHRTVKGLESNMIKIAEAYQRVARDGKRKDQAYDQLYDELRQYKDNFLVAAQKPLFRDIILLYDGVSRAVRQFEELAADAPITRADVLQALAHIREEVLEILYRRDIELIDDQPDKLDIEIQKPVRRIETDKPDEDRAVDQVVRDGFRISGVVFRPQEVVVKRYLKEKEGRS